MDGFDLFAINFYATCAAALSLLLSWVASAIFQQRMGFRLKDKLAAGNVAVAVVMMGIFIGNGIGIGIIIGFSLSSN